MNKSGTASGGAREDKPAAHAVILAGGRGTRFWPRSRTRTPKQLLNIAGPQTMLEQTLARLEPIFPAPRLWVVTNEEQSAQVRRQAPRIRAENILAEPVGRNTAAAIGLAAVHILRDAAAQQGRGDGSGALMAILPADQFIAQAARYRRIVRAALRTATRPGALVVLGIPPTRPETGYGYIEFAGRPRHVGGEPVYAVRRFTEKPSLGRAHKYLASRHYLWNAGMFFWRVSTFLENLRKHLPKTHSALLRLADAIGTPRYRATLRRIYPQLENISIDYALLEPATRNRQAGAAFVLPAAIGWSDIGSWQAVYELEARGPKDNVSAGPSFALDAEGNFLWSPKKFVAAIGIRDLVVVDTPDALLICPRDRAQDVGKIVKWLETNRGRKLL